MIGGYFSVAFKGEHHEIWRVGVDKLTENCNDRIFGRFDWTNKYSRNEDS